MKPTPPRISPAAIAGLTYIAVSVACTGCLLYLVTALASARA